MLQSVHIHVVCTKEPKPLHAEDQDIINQLESAADHPSVVTLCDCPTIVYLSTCILLYTRYPYPHACTYPYTSTWEPSI